MGLDDNIEKKQASPKQDSSGRPQFDFKALSALALVTQLGLGIGITAVGGVFLGRWIDLKLGTGIFVVIGVVLGLAAGIFSAYRLIRRTLG